jgi:DNA-binding response OmpR family regulator
LVEDDLDTREALDELLSGAGYEVIPATSGKQAIEYLLADPYRPPDAVVLDLMLPLVSGWQVLELIRADSRLAAVPVIVTTGVRPTDRRVRQSSSRSRSTPPRWLRSSIV